MRLDDKTFITRDEEGSIVTLRIGNLVQELLEALKLDTYNEQYIIRITVDKIDSGEDLG
jgi:hypothetical protein